MKESMWQNAEITPVLIDTGVFELDRRRRYRPAAFCLLELDGETYFSSVGFEANPLDALQNDSATVADLQMRTGFGFMRPPILVEDCAIGSGNDDTILSLNALMQ